MIGPWFPVCSRALVKPLMGLLILVVAMFSSSANAARWYQQQHPVFGTMLTIELWASSEQQAMQAFALAFGEVDRIERSFTQGEDRQDLRRLNRLGAHREVIVNDELFALLRIAQSLTIKTLGAFDIARGPREERNFGLVALAMGNKVKFYHPAIQLDLTPMIKGFSLDCAAEKLKLQGILHARLALENDLVFVGDRRDRPWRFDINAPSAPEKPLFELPVFSTAIATSNGPSSKKQALNNSATVITEYAVQADAMAEALRKMPINDALHLVDVTANTEAVLIDEQSQVHVSSGLKFLIEGGEAQSQETEPSAMNRY